MKSSSCITIIFEFWEVKHERFLSLPDSLYFENQPWALNYNHLIEIQKKRTNRDVSKSFFRYIFNSYFLKEGIGFWYFWGRKKSIQVTSITTHRVPFPSLTHSETPHYKSLLPVLLNTKCPVFYHMPFRKRFGGLIRNWNLKCTCKSGFFLLSDRQKARKTLEKTTTKKDCIFMWSELGFPFPWENVKAIL